MSAGSPYELGGDFLTISGDGDTTTFTFDDKGTGRRCGSCTLCCKLVPVKSLEKKAGVRCRHQKTGKGCGIYADRPFDCRTWSCRWLADRETAGMKRPDRAHYVIDMMPDYITITETETGAKREVSVMQVWVDPAFRDAYRSPELRGYMAGMAEKYRMPTIVRWSSSDALTVFPPAITDDGEWHELRGSVVARNPSEEWLVSAKEGETQ